MMFDRSFLITWLRHIFYLDQLGDKIALNRSVADIRHKEWVVPRPICDTKNSRSHFSLFIFSCSKKLYLSELPTVSVVVPFFNEHWSTLLRTCYSVLNRSPPELIVEIILVDDCSTKIFLKEKLDRYVAEHLPKVKIVRLPTRSGLIVARLAGAKISHGDVLIFLDSHTEANTNWLPPLLGKCDHVWPKRNPKLKVISLQNQSPRIIRCAFVHSSTSSLMTHSSIVLKMKAPEVHSTGNFTINACRCCQKISRIRLNRFAVRWVFEMRLKIDLIKRHFHFEMDLYRKFVGHGWRSVRHERKVFLAIGRLRWWPGYLGWRTIWIEFQNLAVWRWNAGCSMFTCRPRLQRWRTAATTWTERRFPTQSKQKITKIFMLNLSKKIILRFWFRFVELQTRGRSVDGRI